MEGLKIKCRSCGSTDLYETTEKYDPDIPLTGDMLRLQEPYNKFNWEVYDGALADKSTSRFLMFCTRCGGYITATGQLNFVDKIETQKDLETTDVWKSMEESREAVEGHGQSVSEKSIEVQEEQFVCPFPGCGKICRSKAGLGAHMRVHKTEE